MEIHLPDELERYVDDQVKSGRFPTRDQLVQHVLEDFRLRDASAGDPLLGLFADEPGLMDEVVEAAMRDREALPLRIPVDG